MKIKIILLIMFVFVLCGCEAVYNLDITDGYHETISIIPSNDSEKVQLSNAYPELYYAVYNSDDVEPESEPSSDIEYYNKKLDDNKILTFDYKFKDRFADSKAASYCYPSFLYIKGKYIRLNTLGEIDCFDDHPLLDKITVNIKVGEEVHNHNADSVNGNVYTWELEKGKARAINIEFENPDYNEEDYNLIIPDDTNDDKKENQKENNESKKETNSGENDNLYIFLLTGLFFIILFVIIFFRNKFKN